MASMSFGQVILQQQRQLAHCLKRGRSGSRSCQQGLGRVQQKGAGGGQLHWWSAHWLALVQGSGAVLVCYLMLHGDINTPGFWLSGFFVQEE